MSVKVCDTCIAKTASGRRCKRTTCRTPYCFQHLSIEKGLKIAPSKIRLLQPNGQLLPTGLGLFATKDFPKNKPIVPYTGEFFDHNPDPDNPNSVYVLQLSRNRWIDAKRTDSIGRYSNSCRRVNENRRECSGNNAKFTRHFPIPNLTASRKIKKGSEILSSYGRSYFT
jgi:hypothetical protein